MQPTPTNYSHLKSIPICLLVAATQRLYHNLISQHIHPHPTATSPPHHYTTLPLPCPPPRPPHTAHCQHVPTGDSGLLLRYNALFSLLRSRGPPREDAWHCSTNAGHARFRRALCRGRPRTQTRPRQARAVRPQAERHAARHRARGRRFWLVSRGGVGVGDGVGVGVGVD